MSEDNLPQTEWMGVDAAQFDRARGDRELLGKLLDAFRDQLRAAAERDMQEPLKKRLAPSDLVQQTMLSAVQNFAKFEGQNAEDLHRWLARIQDRNLRDRVREHLRAAKRGLGREQNGPAGSDGVARPDPKSPTPSGLAVTAEEGDRLLEALRQLPKDQQEAVRLRHLEGRSLAEIVQILGRSRESVAALIKRGLVSLRLYMTHED